MAHQWERKGKADLGWRRSPVRQLLTLLPQWGGRCLCPSFDSWALFVTSWWQEGCWHHIFLRDQQEERGKHQQHLAFSSESKTFLGRPAADFCFDFQLEQSRGHAQLLKRPWRWANHHPLHLQSKGRHSAHQTVRMESRFPKRLRLWGAGSTANYLRLSPGSDMKSTGT